jgi:hypothetical protein
MNKTHFKVHISKHFSDSFLIQNCLKQEGAPSALIFNFALKSTVRIEEWCLLGCYAVWLL